MSLFEDVSTLFAAAITDGQDNEAIVKAAYEDLLGYADADTMNNSAARIDYWVQKLSSGELTTDNFGGSFLEEANTNQGSLISSTTFENNQTVVAAHEDAYEANPDVTLEDLTAVAAENRVEDVAEEDEGVTGETFTLTTNTDQIDGSTGDDTVSGLVESAAAANDGSTFGSADVIDGSSGSDTLDIRVTNLAGAATTTVASVSGVENVDVQNLDAGNNIYTYDGSTTTGLTSVGVNNGDASSDTTFTNIGSVVEVDVEDSVDALTVTHDATLLEGASDTVTVNATDATVGTTLDINAGDDAIEGLAINSAGTASDLRNLDVGTSLETLTLSGAGDVQLDDTGGGSDSFDDVTSVDASSMTGDVDINMGGNDENLTFSGGAGADRVVIASGELTSDDTIGGGDGDSDRLAIAEADIAQVADATSSIEELEFTDNGVTADLSTDVGGITTFVYSGDGVLTPTNNEDGFTHILVADAEDIDPDQSNDNLSNVLNVELRDADVEDGGDADIGDGDDDTINLTSSANEDGSDPDNGPNAVDGVDVAAGGTINVDGSANLTVGELGNAAEVNASAFTGALDITGSGNADDITGGSGDDTIAGSGGNDTLTGGAGDDLFSYAAAGSFGDTVNDFSTAGDNGNDVVQLDAGTAGGNLFNAAIDAGGIQVLGAAGEAVATDSGTVSGSLVISEIFGTFASSTAFASALNSQDASGLDTTTGAIAFALTGTGSSLNLAVAQIASTQITGANSIANVATGDVTQIAQLVGISEFTDGDIVIV